MPVVLEWADKHSKAAKPLIMNYFAKQDDIFNELLARKIRFGEARARFRVNSRNFVVGLNAAEHSVDVENATRRQAYVDLLVKAALSGSNDVPVQPLQKPTTCVQSGNVMTCN